MWENTSDELLVILFMYHIYHTEAIILGGKAVGEGDRMLYCYTRLLGLVAARARSLREGRSKLRYALQTFSHAEVNLVRGKYGWRLISAHPVDSFSALWRHSGKRRIIAGHAQLIRRLIQGEERQELLFDDILSGLQFLSRLENERELHAGELILVVRALAHLGYWGDRTTLAPLFAPDGWTAESLQLAHAKRAPLLSRVNQALSLSNL